MHRLRCAKTGFLLNGQDNLEIPKSKAMRSELLISVTTVLKSLGKLTCLVIGACWLLAHSLADASCWEVAALEEACSASHSTSASVSC